MGGRAWCLAHCSSLMRALAVTVLALTVLVVPAFAEELQQVDRLAPFKTQHHHQQHQKQQGPDDREGPGGILAAPTFSGAGYPAPSPSGIVTPTTTVPEAEQHIAVDPNNPSNLVAAVSDFALGGFNTTKYVFSRDAGATWTESYVPTDPFGFGFLATGDGFFWLANSDPVVAIDTHGFVYMANLYLDVFDNGNGLYVSVTNLTGGVVNFTANGTRPVDVHASGTTTIFADKPWLTVDNSSNGATAGTVYATWSRFVGNSDLIMLSRSTNHGQTWSRPIRINPPSQDGAVQGSQVAVGRNGEVYVAYVVSYIGGKSQLFMAKSTNRGVSFSVPRAITPVFNDASFGSKYRVFSLPALATDLTRRGTLYVAYSDQPDSTVGAEVKFVSSTDGGATFSAPVAINDVSQGHQFMPAITVDSSGVIHATWFDTRNSPTDPSKYDVYDTFSKFPGTWAPNTRVTPATIDAATATFIGDYTGIAAGGGFAHPVWTSGGFNNGSLQTTKLPLP